MPRPTISWLGSTGVRIRVAYTRESTLVSANDTSATASPPISTDVTSSTPMSGNDGTGNPWGSGPSTDKPARAARSNPSTASVAATTAIRMAGMRGRRCRSRIEASVLAPTRNAATLVFPSSTPLAMAQICRSGPSVCTEKPKSFGS